MSNEEFVKLYSGAAWDSIEPLVELCKVSPRNQRQCIELAMIIGIRAVEERLRKELKTQSLQEIKEKLNSWHWNPND